MQQAIYAARVLIVEGEADVDARDAEGRTALHLAMLESADGKSSDKKSAYYVERPGYDSAGGESADDKSADDDLVCGLIVEGKADFDARDSEGKTALHLAMVESTNVDLALYSPSMVRQILTPRPRREDGALPY